MRTFKEIIKNKIAIIFDNREQLIKFHTENDCNKNSLPSSHVNYPIKMRFNKPGCNYMKFEENGYETFYEEQDYEIIKYLDTIKELNYEVY